MRKNKTLLSLLALGVLSTSLLVGCEQSNSPTNEVTENEKNKQAAESVIAQINVLTDTSSEADVVAVRTAYEALTDAQKALVNNLAKLEKQEERIAGEKAVQAVIAAIAALNDSSSKDEINAAFTAYVNLDDELKENVTNVAALMYQKARIDAKDVVDPVVELINALSNTSTKAEVEAAASAFNALSSDDKQFISAEVVAKLEAQLTRILQEDIALVKEFLSNVVVEDLISDASVIEIVHSLSSLDLTDEVIAGLTTDEQAKLTLLKKTTNSYEYAGENQATTWFEEHWSEYAYGKLTFADAQHDDDINASVRPFTVTYAIDGEGAAKQEFGMTIVGDNSLKSAKEAVFYLYNPDIDTTMRVDYAKGTEESFCKGGNISIKHGWNRVNVGLSDVVEGKNIVNFMVGIFESAGGLTLTEGWKVSSFVKYDENVSGAIRTEYYRILKVLNAYVGLAEPERNAFNNAMEEYAKLSAEEKAMLPAGIETKLEADAIAYKEADARALNDILAALPGIADGTNLDEYAVNYLIKILSYKAQYDAFDDSQKALVTNYSKVSDALDALGSYQVLSDGSQKLNGWDYGNVGGTTTAVDPVHGTVQSITLEDDAQHSVTLPASTSYVEFDEVLVSVYSPSERMDVVAGPYWPYAYGSVSVGWNVIRISSEVFTTEYPVNSAGLFLYGAGEWKFGSIIGFTNEAGAAHLVDTINGLSFAEHSEAQEQAIKDARAAYEALGVVSKTLVTNYDTLVGLEAEVEAYYVSRVIDAIDALSFDAEGTTQEAQKAAIEAARAMYDALSDGQKAGVTNYTKLTDLEAAVVEYYHDVLVQELEDKANTIEKIENSTTFDVALATLNTANGVKASDLYSEISGEASGKVEAAIEQFNAIYTKLSENMTGIAGNPTISKKVDPTYGTVNSVIGSDTSVQAVFGQADFAAYDALYILVKTEITAGFNLWGPNWTTDVQSFNLIENTWTVLKILPSTYFTTALDTLDFCLGELTNNHELLISGVYGHIPYTAPFIGEDDTIVYSGCGINSSLNGWATFTGSGEDDTYGTYTIVDIEAAGQASFDVIVNGTGGLEPGKYSTVKFALYNPTTVAVGLHVFMSNNAWGELSNQNIGTIAPGWNEVKIDANLLENAATFYITLRLDFTNGGNANGWRISKFVASPISLVKTSYHFGQVSDSGETHATYGKIYNLIQEQWFIDNPDAGTLASAGTGALRAQLPEGKAAFEFAMYNPTDTDIQFHIAGGTPWTDGPFTTLVSKQWTVVSITSVDISINDSGTIYFYMSNANAAGWKITDIWAK